ncbi:MAG: hypothetical protein Q4C30_07810 [Bacteroidia bacterium]|nr:hypothetical protein [Bacteroidia bacterium]
MIKHYLHVGTALLTLLATTTSCLDDLDTDKISSDIEMNMGLVVPMANAEVTLEDFANPEKFGAVEYFDAPFAKDLLRFRDGKAAIYKNTLFSLLGMAGELRYSSQALDYDNLLGLGYITFDGEKEITKSTNLRFRVSNKLNVNIKSILASMDVEVASSACTAECEFALDFPDGNAVELQLPNGETMKSLKDVTLTCEDGYINIPLTIKAKVKSTSRIGDLKFNIVLTELSSFVASAGSALKVNVKPDVMATGMHGFKRFQGTVVLNDPKLTIFATNTTGLNVAVVPNVSTFDATKTEELYMEPFTISAKSNEEPHEFTNKNCEGIDYVFDYFPEKLSVGADIEMTMPNGEDEVEITSKDEVVIGYEFDIPAQMSFKGTVEAESVDFTDVSDDLDDVERARIITNSTCTFPFYAQVRIDFVSKSSGKIFGEPLYINLMDKPNLDENGVCISKGDSKIITTDLSSKQIQQMRESKELLFSVAINENEEEAPMVWLQKSNKLGFNISLAAGFNVDNK